MSYKAKYVIFDLETGGLKPEENPITEIAVLVVDPYTFEEINRWETYVKNYNSLKYHPKALELTGISLSDIKTGGIEVERMVGVLIDIFKEYTPKGDRGGGRPMLAGHNLGFDIDFLKYAFFHCNKDLNDYVLGQDDDVQRLDTLPIAKLMWDDGSKKSYKLVDCCDRAGLDDFPAHRAMNDVLATWELLKWFREQMNGETKIEKVVGNKDRKSRVIQNRSDKPKFSL